MTRITLMLLPALLFAVAACTRVKTDHWPNGQIKSSVAMKGSAYHGKASYYYENGNPQIVCSYTENKLNGPYMIFYPSGSRKEEQHYVHGIQVGISRAWDLSGNLVRSAEYQDGKLHGKFTEYYPDGESKITGGYKKGYFDGLWLYYDEAGMVVGEGRFTMGNGLQRAFYPNGWVKQVTPYSGNNKHGKEQLYRPDGTLSRVNQYDNGKLLQSVEY